MEQKKIKKVGIICKKNIRENLDVLKKVASFMNKHHKEVLLDKYSAPLISLKNLALDKDKIVKKSDMIIALGGDGTLLKIARCLSVKKTPILGINVGTLGFLTEVAPDKLIPSLEKLLDGNFFIDRRFLLRVTIYRKGKKIFTSLALNDAVINQGNFARLITLKIAVNQRKVASIKADGLIAATPTGSTGHSLSAGGPIVHPNISAFILTPICPATLAIRPIVIPNNRQITITIDTLRRSDIQGSDIGLTLDGQTAFSLQYGDEIKIRKSKKICHLIRLSNAGSYYKKLRNKLNWGGE